MIAGRLKELRKEAKLTQADVAKILDISESAYGYYEQGRNEISLSNLNKLSKRYNVSVAYILGESNRKETNASKDEKDIIKRMAAIKRDLESAEGLAFNGEPMSDEAKESLLEAMEYAVRTTQKINKKYVPKKYRDRDE
ncbi:helix-turn-helix domain-containing protein [Rummeliibacillus sp. NPDC094406]|uniref:helix-turn-helix domain-containing protein n=1 Tax=Rummeliibacillus sp. NPDC094406 TaxID=3364511 RepID=UPI00382D5026